MPIKVSHFGKSEEGAVASMEMEAEKQEQQ
jgi:hypothetical protein